MLVIFAVSPTLRESINMIDLIIIPDGKIENERMPHAETLLELSIFDEIRRQGGYELPEGLEKVKLSK